jgi:DivIVA domain-containing protein
VKATRRQAAAHTHRGVRERRRVPAEFRNVSFPVAVRGYDRRAVDSYVARVNRVIAELEATHSPEAAIRHALDRAEERTRGGLEKARKQAEEIIAAARRNADETTSRAKAEAADIVVNASTRADRSKLEVDAYAANVKAEADEYAAKAKGEADEHVAKARAEAEEILAGARKQADESLQRSRVEVAAVREKAEAWASEFFADTEALWKERRELLDDVRELAARLATAASNAVTRVPSDEQPEQAEARNARTK